MTFEDNSLILDYWKEFYGEEIRKRELLILKMKLALEFYGDYGKEGIAHWFSGGCEGCNEYVAPMGTKAREVLKELEERG